MGHTVICETADPRIDHGWPDPLSSQLIPKDNAAQTNIQNEPPESLNGSALWDWACNWSNQIHAWKSILGGLDANQNHRFHHNPFNCLCAWALRTVMSQHYIRSMIRIRASGVATTWRLHSTTLKKKNIIRSTLHPPYVKMLVLSAVNGPHLTLKTKACTITMKYRTNKWMHVAERASTHCRAISTMLAKTTTVCLFQTKQIKTYSLIRGRYLAWVIPLSANKMYWDWSTRMRLDRVSKEQELFKDTP